MSLYPIAFWALSIAAVASAIMVAWARNPLISALFMASTFLSLSSLFLMLHAHFLGLVQILIYAGAIVVLFVYVIMLLELSPKKVKGTYGLLIRVLGAVAFSSILLVMSFNLIEMKDWKFPPLMDFYPSTVSLAEELFTVYMVPFELVSVVLMIGIIGAVLLVKKIEKKE